MRDFKKHFFTSLIQLTILANVFRQNSRYSNLINDSHSNYFLTSDSNTTLLDGQLDLILLRDNSHFNSRFDDTSRSTSNLNNNYRTKETLSYLKDLKLINLLNRYNLSPSFTSFNHNPILLLPASFLNSTNTNQKDIGDLTETRLLLNSIELNLNNPTLKKEFEMDIELQTLIEQDIDLGIKNIHYYGPNNLDMIGDPSVKFDDNLVKPTKFENNFELEFKNEDIIAATKYMQDEDLSEDIKLFVEEDTGELVLIPYDQHGNSITRAPHKLLSSNTSLFTDQSSNCSVKSGISYGNRSIFDPLPDQIQKPPCLVHDALQQQAPPLFLSEVSVCKTLESLNQEENDSSNSNNTNLVDSLLSFNDTLLKDFFSSNNETSAQNYSTFYNEEPANQAELIVPANNSILAETTADQANLLGDQFTFEDQFLKEFEANLDKYGLNEFVNASEPTGEQTIRNNQTIGGDYSASANKSPIYVSEQKLQLSSSSSSSSSLQQQQNDTEPLIEQININDLFKILENESTLNTNNVNASYPNAPQSFINVSKLNTTNDDEAEILHIFKQESIEINETHQQNSLSTSNLPHLAQTEELTAAIRGFQHNHTYLDGLRELNNSEVYHPYSYKNKLKKMLKNLENSDDQSMHVKHQESRDQILLQENKINATLNQVVESSADDFNELVKELQLNNEQLTIIKDIRRRGKNKVAAQICRKRKIDSIETLKEDVEQLAEMKLVLDNEHDQIQSEIHELTRKFDELYKELMGDNHGMNDAMVAYVNNLKGQVVKTTSQAIKQQPRSQRSLLRSSNSDHSDDTISDDYDESSNQSNDDIIESPSSSIKKFKNY